MKKNLVIITLMLIFLITGCEKGTINTYVDPTFQRSDIKRVAVFPIRNAQFAPSEAQELNRKISMAINKLNPNVVIVDPASATQILNDNNLANDWATFLEHYVSSGIPDAQALTKIGKTLNVDSILQGEVVNVIQRDGSYWAGVPAGTRVTVRFTLLSVDKGKLIWEASSDGVISGSSLDDAPPIIQAINIAMDKITQNIPF